MTASPPFGSGRCPRATHRTTSKNWSRATAGRSTPGLTGAYDIFADRASGQLKSKGGAGSKQERVRDYVLRHGPGRLEVNGVGRSATWQRIG